MKERIVKAQSFFFLAPPLVSERGYGFAVIQLGVNFSETIILRMNEWSASAFILFWKNELTHLVDGIRSKGLLPSGVYRDQKTGRLQFGERWEIFRCGDEIVFHDRTTMFIDDPCFLSSSKVEPAMWWQLIPDYTRNPLIQDENGIEYESEWRVSLEAVTEWCNKYECVIQQMGNIDGEDYFEW